MFFYSNKTFFQNYFQYLEMFFCECSCVLQRSKSRPKLKKFLLHLQKVYLFLNWKEEKRSKICCHVVTALLRRRSSNFSFLVNKLGLSYRRDQIRRNFVTLGNVYNSPWANFPRVFSICNNFEPTLANIFAIGQIFIVVSTRAIIEQTI